MSSLEAQAVDFDTKAEEVTVQIDELEDRTRNLRGRTAEMEKRLGLD